MRAVRKVLFPSLGIRKVSTFWNFQISFLHWIVICPLCISYHLFNNLLYTSRNDQSHFFKISNFFPTFNFYIFVIFCYAYSYSKSHCIFNNLLCLSHIYLQKPLEVLIFGSWVHLDPWPYDLTLWPDLMLVSWSN